RHERPRDPHQRHGTSRVDAEDTPPLAVLRGGRQRAPRCSRRHAGDRRQVKLRRDRASARLTRPRKASNAGLLRQRVYEGLRDDIISGKLSAGTVLSPVALARELDVSVMPVREALRLLDENGLLEVEPRRWTKVAGPDPSVAAAVYPLLSVLAEYAMLSAP